MKRAMTSSMAVVVGTVVLGWVGRASAADAGAMDEWQKRLGLTPEQIKKIKPLRADFQKKAEKLRPSLKEKGQALRKLFEADKPDRTKIHAAVVELGKLQTQLTLARIDFRLSMLEVLNKEQRAKLRSEFSSSGKRGRFRPGKGPANRAGRDSGRP